MLGMDLGGLSVGNNNRVNQHAVAPRMASCLRHLGGTRRNRPHHSLR